MVNLWPHLSSFNEPEGQDILYLAMAALFSEIVLGVIGRKIWRGGNVLFIIISSRFIVFWRKAEAWYFCEEESVYGLIFKFEFTT